MNRNSLPAFASLGIAALAMLLASGCGAPPGGPVAVAQNAPLKPAAPPADAKDTLPPFPLAPSGAAPVLGTPTSIPPIDGQTPPDGAPPTGTPAPNGGVPTPSGTPPATSPPSGGPASIFQGLLGNPPATGPTPSGHGPAPPANVPSVTPQNTGLPASMLPGAAPTTAAPSGAPAAQAPVISGPAEIVTGSGKQLDKAVAGVGAQGRGYDQGLVTTPVASYFHFKQAIAFDQIHHDLEIFKAINSRYPKSAEELKKEILKPANITLPELPAGQHYVYDPETGELFVSAPAAGPAGAASSIPTNPVAGPPPESPPNVPVPADKNSLDGPWVIVSKTDQGQPAKDHDLGRYTFMGNRGTVAGTVAGGRFQKKFTLKLDASKSPKQIDFVYPGATYPELGIYDIKDGQLTICVRDANLALGRPTELTSSNGSGLTLMVLKRPADSTSAPPTAHSTDAGNSSSLDGKWAAVSNLEDGQQASNALRYKFNGNNLIANRLACSIKLDPSKSPKQIDIFYVANLPPTLGIYEIKDGTLTLCTRDSHKELGRPTEFASKPKSGITLTVFERQQQD